MKRLIAVTLTAQCFFAAHGQSAMKEILPDPTEKKFSPGGVILTLRREDSIMVGFTRADQEGKFLFQHIPPVKIII
jgi:hypothetical protein